MRAHRRIQTQSNPLEWRRDLHLLALSRTISMAGAEAGYIALIALAWHMTGSASTASLVLLAAVAARTLGAPIAGTIGDRCDRRRVIVVSELAVAASLLATALSQNLWQLMLACGVTTFAASTCGAALDASVPNLVPRSALTKANSTLGMARTAGHMVGPMLGGGLVALMGARSAFMLDAASSVVAAIVVLAIRGSCGGRADAAAVGDDRPGMLAGVVLLANDRILRLLAVAWGCMCVCFAFVTAAELPLSVHFGMDEPGLGMIVTAWCAGSLLGSWWARRIAVERRGAQVLALTALTCCAVFTATGLASAFWQVLAFMSVGGFAMSLGDVVEMTIIQERTEDAIRARVLTAYQGLMSLIWGTNLAMAGLLVDTFSPGTTYILAGVWCLVGAVGFTLLGVLVRRDQYAQQVRSLRLRHALESELAEGA